ncbi:hypothetical protein B0H17DRAFT_1151675 [Mycena rosella]|uniref:Uncharacterized protein n=1 Tax=Mycena rosella TaxID=1033263 RepID=A0AAD7BJD4_MYCRO|nr:hypothetical protein B0H17DRAFT_1151675 [Mycena rosella]
MYLWAQYGLAAWAGGVVLLVQALSQPNHNMFAISKPPPWADGSLRGSVIYIRPICQLFPNFGRVDVNPQWTSDNVLATQYFLIDRHNFPDVCEQAMTALAVQLGQKSLSALPEPRQQCLTRFIVDGCCTHKGHNCSKSSVESVVNTFMPRRPRGPTGGRRRAAKGGTTLIQYSPTGQRRNQGCPEGPIYNTVSKKVRRGGTKATSNRDQAAADVINLPSLLDHLHQFLTFRPTTLRDTLRRVFAAPPCIKSRL